MQNDINNIIGSIQNINSKFKMVDIKKSNDCPFRLCFDNVDCSYMEDRLCKGDIEINAGNGDAWCSEKIEFAINCLFEIKNLTKDK